ncbi:ATP synthase subunit gamma, mitochondrial [Balamuthia mandrillaris]
MMASSSSTALRSSSLLRASSRKAHPIQGSSLLSGQLNNDLVMLSPMGVRHYPGGGLKELRGRIASISSIKKITTSMKMIAAAKLTKAQQRLNEHRPYGESSQRWLDEQYPRYKVNEAGEEIIQGEDVPSGFGQPLPEGGSKHLLVPVTSDRGLCGSVNSAVVKAGIRMFRQDPKHCKFFVVGEKAKAALVREFGSDIVSVAADVGGNKKTSFTDIAQLAEQITAQDFDRITILFNRFNSVLSSTVKRRTLPGPAVFAAPENFLELDFEDLTREEVLTDYYQFSIANLLYSAFMESQASELGARMSSMDSATNNATDVLGRLRLQYNGQRQAIITTELTEIVSGAAALEDGVKED